MHELVAEKLTSLSAEQLATQATLRFGPFDRHGRVQRTANVPLRGAVLPAGHRARNLLFGGTRAAQAVCSRAWTNRCYATRGHRAASGFPERR